MLTNKKLAAQLYFVELKTKEGKFGNAIPMPYDLTTDIIAKQDINDKDILVLYNIEFALCLVEEHNVDPSRITVYGESDLKQRICDKMGVKFITEFDNTKFDVIIANPPYKGTAALHQKFFNKAVELLKDDGQMTFIQPATPYFNKKTNLKKAELEMQDNLRKYQVEVQVCSPKVFKNAKIATDLTITTLTKTESENNVIDQFTTMSNQTFNNVALEDIYATETLPAFARSIREKIYAQITKNGSLEDIAHYGEQNNNIFRLSYFRGNATKPDFYTLLSDNAEYWYMGGTFGLKVEEKQMGNVVSYLTSYVARYALSLLKFNLHIDRGELKGIPLVDFDQTWDDAKLCELFGLTDEEFAEIKRVIPAYHQGV